MINREPTDPRLSPISLRRELVAAGYTDKAIRRLVADGTLARLRYGSYVSGAAWRACDEIGRHGLLARAVLRRAESELVLSHVTAAGEWDIPLWDTDLDVIQATRLDGKAGRRREAGVFQHVGALRDGDVIEMNGVLVTNATRTAVDCMTVFDVEHGLATVNSLLRRGLTSRLLLHECAGFMSSWPGTLNHRVVLGLATAVTESVGEDRTLFLLWNQGLPPPVPQYEINDPNGDLVARVDFAWPELQVFVEFDGKIKYQPSLADGESPTDIVLREKRREERICELTGWTCVRITWSDLAYPQRTAARIKAKFRATSAAS
jgi:hypothetical protein